MLEEHAEALGQVAPTAGGDEAEPRDDEQDAPDPKQEVKSQRSRSASTSTKAGGKAHNRDRKDKRKQAKKQASKDPKPKAHYWSAHDPDASYGHKGLGYHVHIAETCRNDDKPELITDFDVLTAAQSDIGQAPFAVERLRERGLEPEVLYADGGYPTPNDLVTCREAGTELMAPVNRGRMAPEALSRMDFERNQRGEVVSCPAGHRPTRVAQRASSDTASSRRSLHVFFDAAQCNRCAQRARCPVRTPNNTRSKSYRLDVGEELMARDARWVEQQTEGWKQRYRIRGGIEATNSELKRAHRLGRLRVRRMPRVRLHTAFKLIACNIERWARAIAAELTAPQGGYRRLYALLSLLTALHSPQRSPSKPDRALLRRRRSLSAFTTAQTPFLLRNLR